MNFSCDEKKKLSTLTQQMRKILSKALLFSALLLAGCSPSPQENQKKIASSDQLFRLNLHSEPSTLDPRQARDIPTITTGKMLFEGLMRQGLDNQPHFAIAKSLSLSDDRKVYTFTLGDTFWSNGFPVTAYDFESAWKHVLSPNFPAENAHQLFVLKNGEAAKKGEAFLDEVGVHAVDAHTLVVELEYPSPFFLNLTSFPTCFPICSEMEKLYPKWADEQGERFICNGPFKLVKWEHGSELCAQKNPLYWDAKSVQLEKIVLTMIEDEHTELNMYENDELDWAGSPNSSLPPEALPHLKVRCAGTELHSTPLAGTYCFKFNTKAPPFTSAKMRKAFTYAINRKSLVENILQANQLVAEALLPPCMRPQGESAPKLFRDGNREEALALFEEALEEMGWTRETLPPITLIFSRSEKHQKMAQASQQQWNEVFGIKVNLQSYEWNTFLEHLAKRDYQIGGRGWIYDTCDPMALLELYKFTNDHPLGGNNDTQWENVEFVRLLNQATREGDPSKRNLLLREAEELLLSEMPIAPIYHSSACYLKKPYVHDVHMSEMCDLDFKYTYIR